MKLLDKGYPDRLDGTYFTATDCEPWAEGGQVCFYDGHGSRRSWGAPQITTTVVVNDCDFLALHVGFSHKHRGGQYWRYFVRTAEEIERRTWPQLTDDERQIVLDAEGKAPNWAKSPGKLRKDYIRPERTTFTAYKILRVAEGGLTSLYDNTPWALGKRNAQAAKEEHNGGFYVHPDQDKLMNLWGRGALVSADLVTPGTYALMECECSGRAIRYSSGKIAVTYCKPVGMIKTFTV